MSLDPNQLRQTTVYRVDEPLEITPMAEIRLRQMFREEAKALLDEYQKMKPLLSVNDLARTLGVSRRTVDRLVADGKIAPLWISGQRRFHPDQVNAYIRSCTRK